MSAPKIIKHLFLCILGHTNLSPNHCLPSLLFMLLIAYNIAEKKMGKKNHSDSTFIRQRFYVALLSKGIGTRMMYETQVKLTFLWLGSDNKSLALLLFLFKPLVKVWKILFSFQATACLCTLRRGCYHWHSVFG